MEAAENALRAGDKLDRYELLCPIASGGMASVWLARLRGKRGFEKLFAVKTIRTELVEDPRFQEMFLDEARIASGIQHPNVAQILDLGEQNEVLFLVMEWIDGDSLAKIRKLAAKAGRTVPLGPALRILADACAGLHAAHEHRDEAGEPLGIVHRDVSPQNLLVSTAGTVKVIDFGIAKAQNRRQGDTRTGVVKGKLQYMAPEQVKKGRTVDRRADIWSLGMCLHELVAGRLPNDGDDDVEVIRKMLADERPHFAEGLPGPVEQLLAQSVVFEVGERFATAAAMQRAIENAMKELGETARSEDVAAFVQSALPELADRRRAFVNDAISQARDRGSGARASSDDAFAPTVVSDRSPRRAEDARAIALTKRKGGAPGVSGEGPSARERRSPFAGDGPSASTGDRAAERSRVVASSVDEPYRIPKRNRVGFWLVLVAGLLGGAAWAGRRWILPAMGYSGGAIPAPDVDSPGLHVSSDVPTLTPSALAPSASRSEPALLPGAAAAHPSARPAAGEVAEPRSASSAIADAGVAASADAAAPRDAEALIVPAASAAGAVDAAPTPAASAPSASPIDDDPNNPYNVPAPAAPRDP